MKMLPGGYDRSGSIAIAGVAQLVAPLNRDRVSLTFQNTSDAEMRVSEGGPKASATDGFVLGPKASGRIETNQPVWVWCSAAGKTFSSTEK